MTERLSLSFLKKKEIILWWIKNKGAHRSFLSRLVFVTKKCLVFNCVWEFRKEKVWGSIWFRFYLWPFFCGLWFSLSAPHQRDLGRQRKPRSWCGGCTNSPQTRASPAAPVPLRSQHPPRLRAHTHPPSPCLSLLLPQLAQDRAVSQVCSQGWPGSSWHPPWLCEGRWCRGSRGPGLLWLPFPPMVGHSREKPIGVPSTPVWPCSSLILPFEGAAPHRGAGCGCWPSWGSPRWSWLEAPWCPLTLTFLGTKEMPTLSKPSEFAFWNLFLITIQAYCRKDKNLKKYKDNKKTIGKCPSPGSDH